LTSIAPAPSTCPPPFTPAGRPASSAPAPRPAGPASIAPAPAPGRPARSSAPAPRHPLDVDRTRTQHLPQHRSPRPAGRHRAHPHPASGPPRGGGSRPAYRRRRLYSVLYSWGATGPRGIAHAAPRGPQCPQGERCRPWGIMAAPQAVRAPATRCGPLQAPCRPRAHRGPSGPLRRAERPQRPHAGPGPIAAPSRPLRAPATRCGPLQAPSVATIAPMAPRAPRGPEYRDNSPMRPGPQQTPAAPALRQLPLELP